LCGGSGTSRGIVARESENRYNAQESGDHITFFTKCQSKIDQFPTNYLSRVLKALRESSTKSGHRRFVKKIFSSSKTISQNPAGRIRNKFLIFVRVLLNDYSTSIYDIFVEIFPIRSEEETHAGP
jgi:hypothetical protein